MKTGALLEWAKFGAFIAAGFIGYRVITKAVEKGGDVVAAAKDVITTDLNPASTENIVYKAANVVTGGDDSKPLGVRAWEFFNSDKVALENKITAPVTTSKSGEQISPALIEQYKQYGFGQAYVRPTADSISWYSKMNSDIRNLSLGQ